MALQGTGTEQDPYLIVNLSDLEEFSQAPDAPIKYHAAGVYTAMSENVDCTGMENWNGGKGMLPIGADSSTGYYGNFNGNKRRITNLYIDRSLELTKPTGFFGYVNGATISGLRLTGTVKGNGFATASVVGIAENSNISECESSCDIYGVGGGQTFPPYADSNGGIVGIMRLLGGSVSECVFTGTINSTSSNLHVWGGVVGSSFGVPISDCNAISTINVFNSTYTGGFIGYISGNVTITNCYSVAQYYAFCGLNQGVSTIVSCYYNGDIDEGRTEPTTALPKTTGQMETQSTYVGWNFENVWLAEEGQYPQLLVFVPLSIVADPTSVYALAGEVVEMSAVVSGGQQPQTLKLTDTSTGSILSTSSPYSYLVNPDDSGKIYQWEATDGIDTVTADVPIDYVRLTTIEEGDPKLFFGANGATLNFVNGLPIMDNEFENVVNLQILVNSDSPLNRLSSSIDETIGSNLPVEIQKTITRDQMQIVESAAVDALSSLVDQGIFKSVTARMAYITNEGYGLELTITPPVGSDKKLSFVRYNENWISRQSLPV